MKTFKSDSQILDQMIGDIKNSIYPYQPSNFWQELNQKHLNQLTSEGFRNFKRTINLRYFNWGIIAIFAHQMGIILLEIIKGNYSPFIKSYVKDKDKHFNHLAETIYRIYVSSLADYVKREDNLKILEKINEPLIGNPLIVNYKNKSITQDLCNSIHEFYSIYNKVNIEDINQIAEIGAGYGRTAYVFLKILPNIKYAIFDIPPALFISQKYLSKIFKKDDIFYYRPFSKFSEIKSEFQRSKIKFLLPHQMELLPKKYFDLMINISSLHEMTKPQIKLYLKNINRLCKGYFYTKQWIRSLAKDNYYIKENEYPINKSWKLIYKRNPHPIQKLFFDALYKIPCN